MKKQKKRQKYKVEPMYQHMGKIISLRRHKLNMTQADLAASLKISRPSLANIEAGRQRVSLHDLFKFEEVLGMPKALIKAARSSI